MHDFPHLYRRPVNDPNRMLVRPPVAPPVPERILDHLLEVDVAELPTFPKPGSPPFNRYYDQLRAVPYNWQHLVSQATITNQALTPNTASVVVLSFKPAITPRLSQWPDGTQAYIHAQHLSLATATAPYGTLLVDYQDSGTGRAYTLGRGLAALPIEGRLDIVLPGEITDSGPPAASLRVTWGTVLAGSITYSATLTVGLLYLLPSLPDSLEMGG